MIEVDKAYYIKLINENINLIKENQQLKAENLLLKVERDCVKQQTLNFSIHAAIQKFWQDNHTLEKLVAIEELTELSKELCKNLRDEPNRKYIIEEFTDVLIMLKCVQQLFKITYSEIEEVKTWKENRLLNKIINMK